MEIVVDLLFNYFSKVTLVIIIIASYSKQTLFNLQKAQNRTLSYVSDRVDITAG